MTDDIALLRRYVERTSEEAFTELVRRHVDFVYAAALRQARNPHRAQDITQVVFTDLARKAASLVGRTELVGWLYISTHYATTSVVRSEARREKREQEARMIHEMSSDQTASIDWQKLDPVLDAALRGLNDPDRTAILLRFFKNHSFAEIGAALCVTEEAARKRTDRALEKLRRLLARQGVSSTTAAMAIVLSNPVVVAAPAGLAATVTTAALAGSAAGSAAGAMAATKFFAFMNAGKIIGAGAGLLALLAVGVSIHETKLRQQAEIAVAAIGRGRAGLQRALEDSKQRSAALQSEAAILSGRVVTLEAQARNAQPKSAAPASSIPGQIGYVLDHPELRARYLEQEGLRTRINYGRFFEITGLSPGRQNQFVKLQLDQENTKLDLLDALKSQGFLERNKLSKEQAAAVQKTANDQGAKATAELRDGVRALLGDDAFLQYEQYAKTLGERYVVNQLAGQLYFTDAPLAPQQADQVVQVLAANRFHASPGNEPTSSNQVAGVVVDLAMAKARAQDTQQETDNRTVLLTDAAIAQTQGFLSPKQITALKLLQAQQIVQLGLAPPLVGAPNSK